MLSFHSLSHVSKSLQPNCFRMGSFVPVKLASYVAYFVFPFTIQKNGSVTIQHSLYTQKPQARPCIMPRLTAVVVPCSTLALVEALQAFLVLSGPGLPIYCSVGNWGPKSDACCGKDGQKKVSRTCPYVGNKSNGCSTHMKQAEMLWTVHRTKSCSRIN